MIALASSLVCKWRARLESIKHDYIELVNELSPRNNNENSKTTFWSDKLVYPQKFTSGDWNLGQIQNLSRLAVESNDHAKVININSAPNHSVVYLDI